MRHLNHMYQNLSSGSMCMEVGCQHKGDYGLTRYALIFFVDIAKYIIICYNPLQLKWRKYNSPSPTVWTRWSYIADTMTNNGLTTHRAKALIAMVLSETHFFEHCGITCRVNIALSELELRHSCGVNTWILYTTCNANDCNTKMNTAGQL